MKTFRASLIFVLALLASFGGIGHQHTADGYNLVLEVSQADAKVCLVAGDCPLMAAPQSTKATIQLNVSWDTTGIGGTHTTRCCMTAIEAAGATNALILLSGGGGDEFDVCRQFQFCTLATLSYTITGAVWDNTYGGRATYTLSSNPGNAIVVGNVFTPTDVQSTGGTGVGYNGNALTVVGVHTSSPPYTVSVSLPALSSPGTFTPCGGSGQPACGTGTALTITPDSVIYAWVNAFHTTILIPQSLPPLGGTDAGNSPTFTATFANDNTFTATAPAVGIISIPQILTAAGLTGTVTVNGKGTGNGYAGSYTYSGTPQTLGPISTSANACPVAPNTQTWNNRNTTSCRADAPALDDLSKAAQTKYGLNATDINVIGHSEGCGESWELWWEYSNDFGHFGCVSMPSSLYYDAAGGNHTTLPSPMRSMQVIVGALDPDVCITPADNPTCFGTANKVHATISDGSGHAGTLLVAQSIDSGALTPGNQITLGATAGTTITACSDATHCTVSISQLVTSSKQMNTNNLFSTQIGNNSLNYTSAAFATPGFTTWPGYANVIATAANGYTLHGCPAGLGSQINASDGVIANSGTSIQTTTYDYCQKRMELVVVANGAHDMKSISTGMPNPQQGGLPPGQLFLYRAVNMSVP